jgi:Fe-S cluster assembly protein SufD
MAATARKPARRIAFDYGGETSPAPEVGREPSWLRARRAAARALIAEGLPNLRVEEWKYTNLQPLAARRFARAGEPPPETVRALADRAALGASAHRVVLVNGRFDASSSALGTLPEGVEIVPLAAALARDDAGLGERLGASAALEDNFLAAYNTAFFGDGVLVRLAEGRALDRPLHLVSLGVAPDRPIAFHPRVVVELGANSRLSLVESHRGADGVYWSNPLTEIRLDEGAALRHYTLQSQTLEAHHLALTAATLARDARYESVVLAPGAALARHEIDVRLAGEGAEVMLAGCYLIGGTQHSDHTTRIAHLVPRCGARELYKGVLDGAAHGVFQGTIVVHEGAAKTDAHQLSRALLLSPGAEADAKPELMIYADDVKCSHGASSGSLDPLQLFYLRARGLDAATARALLVEGFVAEVLEAIADDAVRPYFARAAESWLAAHRGGAA